MKKSLMRVSILLCFIISLALTTIYLSLPVDADNNEITLDKTDNNAQVSDPTTNNDIEQTNQNEDDSICSHKKRGRQPQQLMGRSTQ